MIIVHSVHDLTAKELEELLTLVEVAQKGSFSAASRSLAKNPTVLSRRISALEGRLGLRVMERSTRSLKLTEVGLALVQRIQVGLDSLREAQELARQEAAQVQGRLKIALPATFGRMWIAPLLPEFMKLAPKVELDVHCSDTYQDLVAEGFHLAVRIGALEDSSLIVRRLADQERVICGSPEYFRTHGRPENPRELAQHSCLRFTGFFSYPHWRFSKDGEQQNVFVKGPLQADDARSLTPAALAGLGLIQAARWGVAPLLDEGRLETVLEDWRIEGTGAIYLVRPSARYTSERVRLFCDWLRECFNPAPWLR